MRRLSKETLSTYAEASCSVGYPGRLHQASRPGVRSKGEPLGPARVGSVLNSEGHLEGRQ